MAKGTVSQKEGDTENHVMRKYIFFVLACSPAMYQHLFICIRVMDMFVIYNTNVDGRVGDSVHMTEGRTVLLRKEK